MQILCRIDVIVCEVKRIVNAVGDFVRAKVTKYKQLKIVITLL